MNYRVLIIGLGNIGFMYDVKKPRLVHSHAKAVMHSKNFILIGAVEKKIKLRKFFEKKFDLPTYGNLEKALSTLQPNFVTISTPTRTHLNLIKKIIKIQQKDKTIKNIIMEKPAGNNFHQTEKILKLAKKNKIKIFVNYIRQYQRDLILFFKFLKNKKFKISELQYNRGLRNNASHFICLMLSIFGNFQKVELLKRDHKNPSFKIKFKKIECSFFKKKNKKNICNIWFKNNRNEIGLIDNSKMIIKKRDKKIIQKKKTNMNKYQLNVYESIFRHLKNNKKLLINDKIILNNSKIIDKIEKL